MTKCKAQDTKKDSITLSWNIYDLPSEFHSAGVAGLLCYLESMRRRGKEPLPEVKELTESVLSITCSLESFTTLMIDLWEPTIISIPIEGKKKEETQYQYQYNYNTSFFDAFLNVILLIHKSIESIY